MLGLAGDRKLRTPKYCPRIYRLFAKAVGAALTEMKCEILVREDMEELIDVGNAKIVTQSCYLGAPIGDAVD